VKPVSAQRRIESEIEMTAARVAEVRQHGEWSEHRARGPMDDRQHRLFVLSVTFENRRRSRDDARAAQPVVCGHPAVAPAGRRKEERGQEQRQQRTDVESESTPRLTLWRTPRHDER